MPKIKTSNGLTCYYEQQGTGEPLILIGGLSADHTVWSFVVPVLSKYFRVLTFDNRGVGQTEAPPGPYTISMMARDVAGLMECLSIEKATMVGHSMGGLILQQFCLDYPEKVTRAVLAASTKEIPVPSMIHIDSVIKLMEANVDPSAILWTTFPWLFGEEFLRDGQRIASRMEALMTNPYPQSLEAFKAQVEACRQANQISFLHRIKTETLVVAGEEDLITPLRCSEELHRGITHSKMAVLKCGHMLSLEKPQEFCRLLVC